MGTEFSPPKQLLAKETYYDDGWFEREKRELFDRAWTYACIEDAIPSAGDFHSFHFMTRDT